MSIADEKAVVGKLIDAALANGASYVSLYDGEEWSVIKDPTGDLVKKELAATDMETVRFRDSSEKHLGSFMIAWGEGPEHIYDHSDNVWANRMWNLAGLG